MPIRFHQNFSIRYKQLRQIQCELRIIKVLCSQKQMLLRREEKRSLTRTNEAQDKMAPKPISEKRVVWKRLLTYSLLCPPGKIPRENV